MVVETSRLFSRGVSIFLGVEEVVDLCLLRGGGADVVACEARLRFRGTFSWLVFVGFLWLDLDAVSLACRIFQFEERLVGSITNLNKLVYGYCCCLQQRNSISTFIEVRYR